MSDWTNLQGRKLAVKLKDAEIDRLTAVVADVTTHPHEYIHNIECSNRAGPRRACGVCRKAKHPYDVVAEEIDRLTTELATVQADHVKLTGAASTLAGYAQTDTQLVLTGETEQWLERLAEIAANVEAITKETK